MSTERDGNMNAVDFSSRAPSERSIASKTKAPASCVPPKRYLCPPFVSILLFRQIALLAFKCKWLSVDPWMHVCVFRCRWWVSAVRRWARGVPCSLLRWWNSLEWCVKVLPSSSSWTLNPVSAQKRLCIHNKQLIYSFICFSVPYLTYLVFWRDGSVWWLCALFRFSRTAGGGTRPPARRSVPALPSASTGGAKPPAQEARPSSGHQRYVQNVGWVVKNATEAFDWLRGVEAVES